MSFTRYKPVSIVGLDKVGLVKSATPDQIPDNAWETALNMRPVNGQMETIPGYEKFVATALTSADRIMIGDTYTKMSGTQYLVLTTLTKTYYYNTGTSAFTDIQGASAFTGDEDNYFSVATAFDTFLIANGVDVIKKWTGTGNIATLGGLTDCEPGAVSVNANIVRPFADFVVLFNTIEDGDDYSFRVRWSKKGQLEVWKNTAGSGQAGYTDLSDSPLPIMQAIGLNDFMVIYKENSIHVMSYVGLPTIFSFRRVVADRGLYARNAVAAVSGIHYFLSEDNFYAFNGSSIVKIGDNIKDEFFNDHDVAKRGRIQAHVITSTDEIWWLYTSTANASSDYFDKAMVYNYLTGAWTMVTLADKITTMFTGSATNNITWDTAPDTTWDDAVGRWNDSTSLQETPIVLLGDADGYIYRVAAIYSQDGTAYTKQLISKYHDLQLPAIYKRLTRLDINVSTPVSSVDLLVYVGHAKNRGDTLTWAGPYTVTVEDAMTATIDVDITDVYFALRFETLATSDPWELVGYTAWFLPRSHRS
ncbi:MAG: hypothetical protein WC822_02315 [Candidatus Paceibacterota bacterium]|jgi:hypothetical protein